MFGWKRSKRGSGRAKDGGGTPQKAAAGAAAGRNDAATDGSGATSDAGSGGLRRLHLKFVGQVQGVGFRWTAQHTARDLGLTGWVYNAWDGSVMMELQGTDKQISEFFGEFAQQFRGYPIHYTIDEKEDIEPDASETDFVVRY